MHRIQVPKMTDETPEMYIVIDDARRPITSIWDLVTVEFPVREFKTLLEVSDKHCKSPDLVGADYRFPAYFADYVNFCERIAHLTDFVREAITARLQSLFDLNTLSTQELRQLWADLSGQWWIDSPEWWYHIEDECAAMQEQIDALRLLITEREQPIIQKIPNGRPGYVYLLKSVSGHWKIGRTSNPSNRMKTFGIQLPFEVEFEHLIPTDNMCGVEATLHARFADKRVNGEWFNLTPEDVEHIKSITRM